MIVFPKEWKKDYTNYIHYPNLKIFAGYLLELIKIVVEEIKVPHLAYSGGIDSMIMLNIMTTTYSNDKVHTYTISSREDHPDVQFARKGSKLYNTTHHEFVVEPTYVETDKFEGDNAVRQMFELLSGFTDKIICGDGIDEFMCGYYGHLGASEVSYKHYISKLVPDHLVPLHEASKNVEVYLPYLDPYLVESMCDIDLHYKVDDSNRKKIIILMAEMLGIPEEFINRNKYGFCDAFLDKDKQRREQ